MSVDGSINHARLTRLMGEGRLDAIVAAAPENTYYLSGVFIRTQVSIRDRLAIVVWPADGFPTFVVCNIEETLARHKGTIADVRTYVEFAESPIAGLVRVLRERGLENARLGYETRFLTQHYFEELRAALPMATFVPADELLEHVRSVKTGIEIDAIVSAFHRTEDAIRDAWGHSGPGDTEKDVADRMLNAILERGADSQRHMTLAGGPNTVYAHFPPGDRALRPGDTVLTDFGGHYYGYSSDMARMGIVGRPSQQQLDEYRRYREVYVRLLHYVRPGITAANVYEYCRQEFEAAGMTLSSPHVGHSLTRMGGHEDPILHPRCDRVLEPDMLLAVEPSYRPRPDQRYHIEDLVRITASGAEILTDWRSTEQMIEIGAR
jgi:Xaa-Pro aminopeptidase